MPLSVEQKLRLKDAATPIKFNNENPKTPGSKAFQRYEKYKGSTTIGETMGHGANWQDISGDFERQVLTIVNAETMEEVGATSSAPKRGPPEGTPDREALSRAKVPAKEVAPKVLLQEGIATETNKIEMSAATIAAMRAMMREELANGI